MLSLPVLCCHKTSPRRCGFRILHFPYPSGMFNSIPYLFERVKNSPDYCQGEIPILPAEAGFTDNVVLHILSCTLRLINRTCKTQSFSMPTGALQAPSIWHSQMGVGNWQKPPKNIFWQISSCNMLKILRKTFIFNGCWKICFCCVWCRILSVTCWFAIWIKKKLRLMHSA